MEQFLIYLFLLDSWYEGKQDPCRLLGGRQELVLVVAIIAGSFWQIETRMQ